MFDREGRPLVVNVRPTDRGGRPRTCPHTAAMRCSPAWPRWWARSPRPGTAWMRSTARHSISCHSSATSDGQPPCSWPRRLPRCRASAWRSCPRRQYLNERGEADGSLLAHVVGYTGPINADELEAMAGRRVPPRRRHRPHRDRGRVRGVLRGVRLGPLGARCLGSAREAARGDRAPVAGRNLVLTIDARLQREWRPNPCCGGCARRT